jgi:hypothetical protein
MRKPLNCGPSWTWGADMGYRSDGKWIIKGAVPDVIAALVDIRMTLPPPPNTDVDLSVFETYQVGGEGYITLTYDGWKWYDGYADVGWLESVWARLSENDKLYGQRVRIGENDDDTDIDLSLIHI